MELTLLQASDAPTVLAFETQHRSYFERWIEPRTASFFTPQGFERALQAALQMQSLDQAWHYLIWQDATLAGRASLTQVQPRYSATLGYRIAPSYAGHGLATQAVAAVLQQAFQAHHLQRLTACARPENRAAIQVLLKNGFQPCGHSNTHPSLHRPWLDVMHFECTALQAEAKLT